jgi:DNA-binding CsgD family transcriptional regulator
MEYDVRRILRRVVTSLTKTDLRSVIDMLHDLAAHTAEDAFPRPVIEKLGALLDSPNAGYCDLQPPRCEGYYMRTLPEPAWFGGALAEWGHQDPIECTRFAHRQAPVAASDVVSRRAFMRLELYQHTLRPFGCADTARLYLPTRRDGSVRFFFFDRERWGLSDRDRQLLQLLRPHFALHRRKWRPAAASAKALTGREREILDAVADGATNAQIARQLWISPHTVRTHLSNIFEKLGAKTRTEAVAAVRRGA